MNESKMDVQGLEPWTSRNPIAKRARYHCAKRPCLLALICVTHPLWKAGMDGPREGRRRNLASSIEAGARFHSLRRCVAGHLLSISHLPSLLRHVH